jgi:DNA-binding response OmpR family regulator
MYVVIVEPDRIIAKLLKRQLASVNIVSDIAPTPDSAMKLIDTSPPDAIVSELSLSGHSAFEFLYELRTYPDLQGIPVIIYTSTLLDEEIRQSNDWALLAITNDFYKPNVSIDTVVERVVAILKP